MTITRTFPKAESDKLPEGISIQPRKFTFGSLESEPKYWLGNSKIATHFENMFSLAIPPGERFFIRSVQRYEDQITDPEHKGLIKAFILQEGLHRSAHNEFNSSLEKHGVNVERETTFFEKYIGFAERHMPSKIMLGVTAFAEHLTATGAHSLLDNPRQAELYSPETLKFWQWHAVEELEHRAVAFDLLKVAKIGYFSRVFSALVSIYALILFGTIVFLRLMRDDPTKLTRKEIPNLLNVLRIMGVWPTTKMFLQYFKPGFHPWDIAPPQGLENWYASNETGDELTDTPA